MLQFDKCYWLMSLETGLILALTGINHAYVGLLYVLASFVSDTRLSQITAVCCIVT